MNKKIHLILGNLLFVLCTWVALEYPVFVGISLDYLDWNYFFRSILILLPVATCLLSFTKRPIIITFLVILFFSLAVETGMMVMYGDFLAYGNILSAFKTNAEEARGFFSMALSTLWYILPLLLWMVGLLFLLFRFRPSFPLNITCTILLVIANLIALEINRKTHSPMGVVSRRLYINEVILSYPPYNTLNQVHVAFKRLRQYRKTDPNFSYKAYIPTPSRPKKEIYILAVGESLRYQNFSMNGTYSRSTTPLLEAMDNVVLYDNYYSCACFTTFSLPIILSPARAQEYDLQYVQPNILHPFKETGFKTFVIANKANSLAEESLLTEGRDSLIVVSSDKEIPKVVHQLSQQYDKIFFVLHFWGNHFVYNNYEEEFDVYKPNVYGMENPPFNNKELNINSYDNTILYTDYLLHTIFTQLDSMNIVSTVLFTPDHGENISDEALGHGFTQNPPKEEYHIPLVIWHSTEWEQLYPSKKQYLYQNKKAPINSENIFYSVCDMANIVIDASYAHPKWSIFQDSLQFHDRYLLMRDGVNVMKVD